MNQVPASQWPDPPNSVRYYTFAVLIPESFAMTSDTKWVVLSQWKGLNGGQPPLTLEVKRDHFRLGGSRTNSGLVLGDGNLGVIRPGVWTEFTFGVRWSPRADQGWIEVRRDGHLVLPRQRLATMDFAPNGQSADPVYFKQGLYRDLNWRVTHTVFFGPLVVRTSP